MDRMLRTTGFETAGAGVSGGVSMLSERTNGERMRDDGGADSPSGVLVGVSPVSAPDARAHAVSSAEHLGLLHVLVVDDDEAVRKACCQIAAGMGFEVVGAESATAARAILKQRRIDLLLLDLKLPGGGGLPLLEQVKALHPDMAVIVMTAFATVSSAVEAMRIGAGDYLTKPFALEELTAVLERTGQQLHMDVQSRQLRERLRTQQGMGGLVGRSPEMEKLYRILSKVAYSTHPVLILGESGTGKELVARSIHFNGPNAAKPFVPVDCGSLVPTLIESELFGHVKGAFTGADRAKEGLLASAEGGTVFLDEIGELPLDLQAKLLRALQEKEVRPVGATQARPISARVLAATNRDLATMVEQGRFRKDLYFRLNVVNLRIPPLRDRRDDIAVLATHFLKQMEKETGVVRSFSDSMLRTIAEYDWPGNVRELENAIERACALSSGPVLHLGDLPTQLQNFRMQQGPAIHATEEDEPMRSEAMGSSQDGIVSIAEMERQAILGTIRQLKGDKLMAAKLLGIGKTTLYRKLKEYGITEGMGD
ncbi:sigma-54 dependent transcriptional regulator [Tunturiibacter empetritectus]|uniref:Two-component system response regulator HydG n=2 Tax=Tunturiibacter empetritectus TaxID=3069691 RepID=A0A7W8MRH6_9BACT|nr:sigma-54 dependent transcriptional regulator [Edaphobacter lichenicola]MBB5316795.1 two-component system response regulator HydG [Edaphobacter lichenicola]